MKQEIRIYPTTKTAVMPSQATNGSAGYDLFADIVTTGTQFIEIPAGHRALVSTGLVFELPEGWEAQIRSRSGLAFKSGICVANSPGTIDSDYRGVVGVILHNNSFETFTVTHGMRIAQVVFKQVPVIELVKLDEHPVHTERGSGGFGSTGL